MNNKRNQMKVTIKYRTRDKVRRRKKLAVITPLIILLSVICIKESTLIVNAAIKELMRIQDACSESLLIQSERNAIAQILDDANELSVLEVQPVPELDIDPELPLWCREFIDLDVNPMDNFYIETPDNNDGLLQIEGEFKSIHQSTEEVIGDRIIEIEKELERQRIEAAKSPLEKLADKINKLKINKYKFKTGYCSSNINVRELPSRDAEVLEVMKFNDEVQYAKYNDDWSIIKYADHIAFMWSELISTERLDYNVYPVPLIKGRELQKSWMPYTAITSKRSKQYKLRMMSYTGNYGIRMYDNRYLVALGSYYTDKIGTYFDIILQNGTVIPCVLGDAKADIHTDSTNRYTVHDGSVAEFLIDKGAVSKMTRRMGSVSYACDSWRSPIVKIRIYNKNVFD